MLKAYKVIELPTWTLGIDCGIIFAENKKEALKIANLNCDKDSKIKLEEIPIEKGYTYIGGHIE